MKPETKLTILSKEIKKHVCFLPKGVYCPCIGLRAKMNQLLEQIALENGLEPELIGGSQGFEDPR